MVSNRILGTVLAAVPALVLASGGTHWSYEGAEGPGHWAELSTDYGACSLGRHQSPVNITSTVKEKLPPIEFDYRPSPLNIVNNGHTVQVNYADGSEIRIGADHYRLVQYHFHTPSEEQVNGRRFDMVAHLVHRNEAGQLAVVAVLFTRGRQDAALQPVWKNMPAGAGAERAVAGVQTNAAELLPAARGYYTFEGSLTTPPCSEGVRWLVLKQPVEMSAGQLAAFRRVFPHNARPVQPLHDRAVKESL